MTMVTFKSIKDRKLRFIDPAQIVASKRNPRGRAEFGEKKLEGLNRSIGRHGVLQPIIVTPVGRDRYRLVEGERRWHVAKAQEVKQIPAYVIEPLDGDDETVAMYHLHMQRKDWNAADELRALRQLRAAAPNATAAQLGEELGMTPSTARNRLAVVDSDPALQDAIERGELKFTDALRAVEAADALARTRAKVVADLGGKNEVARLLAEKARLRRGLGPELVALRTHLVDRRQVPDRLLKRYIKEPKWSRNEIYAGMHTDGNAAPSGNGAARSAPARAGETSRTTPGENSSGTRSGLAARVHAWRVELEQEARDAKRIGDPDALKLELIALADAIDDVQRRLGQTAAASA